MDFIFDNQTFTLINYGTQNNILFKAKDVEKFLGYKNTRKAIIDHVWGSNKYIGNVGNDSLLPYNYQANTIYINEAGLYQLIFSSKMPYAEEFQQFVFEDVLPSIRKTGKFKIDVNKDVNFIKSRYPEALLTVCNGELQNDTFEKREKSFLTGYTSGSFDLILMNITNDYSGFCIEFKNPNGKGRISPNQLLMEHKYKLNGFKTLISNDYNECIIQVADYMRLTRIKCMHCKHKFKNKHTMNNHLSLFHKIKNLE